MTDEVAFVEDDDPREETVTVTVSFNAYEPHGTMRMPYSQAVLLVACHATRHVFSPGSPMIVTTATGVTTLDLFNIARINVACARKRRFVQDVQKAAEAWK